MHLVKPITATRALVAALASFFFLASCGIFGSSGAAAEEGAEESEWVALHPKEYRDAVLKSRQRNDAILALYRDELSREEVVAFFEAILHSRPLAEHILAYASEFDVSPSLALALSWEESRFNPRAVNRNISSIDRGLFQLNSKSFPKLTETEFFNPELNTRYGIAHLRWCLDLAGSEVAALAMYNAGTTRVRQDGTPKKTLDYVSRIQDFRDGVNELFRDQLEHRWIIADGRVTPVAPQKGTEPRLAAVRFPILNVLR